MGWEDLKEVGLTEIQAKVLHSLMKLGESKASEIAKASDISRVRIYDVLKQLYSKGLIRKKKGRPTKYIPLTPEKTFDRLLKQKEQEYQQEKNKILKKRQKIQNELKNLKQEKETNKPNNLLEFISLGNVSETETNEIIKNANKEIKIMSEALTWLETIQKELQKTNTQIKILLQQKNKLNKETQKIQQKNLEKLREINDIEIRYTEKMPLRGTITDKEAVLNVREKESSNLLRDCIYTNHESFIEAMNIYFNNLWRESE